jgi:hypothetical protein
MKNKKKSDYSLLFKSEEVIGKDQIGSLKGGQDAPSKCSNQLVPIFIGTILVSYQYLYIGLG